jgi:hypothetical protein
MPTVTSSRSIAFLEKLIVSLILKMISCHAYAASNTGRSVLDRSSLTDRYVIAIYTSIFLLRLDILTNVHYLRFKILSANKCAKFSWAKAHLNLNRNGSNKGLQQ